ncbi:MAG: hypothetical protein Q3997_04065 [Propionibacteriaceae bacterium]|nr:hypothetical protein [Propionibacteriaceae bacterium]
MSAKPVRMIGAVSMVAGAATAAAGVAAWVAVRRQLRGEHITVPAGAAFLPGRRVTGPLTAYAQAEAIRRNAEAATGGKSFADLGELASQAKASGNEDLVKHYHEKRATAQTASFLRASLMTSVIGFGVSALVAGVGVLFGLIGWALFRLTRPGRTR